MKNIISIIAYLPQKKKKTIKTLPGHQSGITGKSRSGQMCEYKTAIDLVRLWSPLYETLHRPEVTTITT